MPPNVPRSRTWNQRRVDLDDRDRAEALEVHVGGERGGAHRHRRRVVHDQDAEDEVGDRGAGGADQHRQPAAEAVGDGAVDQEGQGVDDRADAVDRPEVVLADAAERLEDGEVVAPHVEERVGQARGGASWPRAGACGSRASARLDPGQPRHDQGDDDEQDEDRDDLAAERRLRRASLGGAAGEPARRARRGRRPAEPSAVGARGPAAGARAAAVGVAGWGWAWARAPTPSRARMTATTARREGRRFGTSAANHTRRGDAAV